MRARRLSCALATSGTVLLLAVLGPGTTTAALAEPPASAAAVGGAEIQVLAINDFHGRIEADARGGAAGAAVLAGAVARLRAEQPNTVFVSAGDNIGASTFTSFIDQDTPTIDALKLAGLELSAVGNHEFDRGIADLTNRVLPRWGEPGGAPWFGLGANVVDAASGLPVLDPYRIVEVPQEIGEGPERHPIRIGFIGTVTEQTATAVNPDLVRGVEFTSQLEAADRVADEIDGLVDLTVLLSHDGSFATDCAAVAAERSVFGDLIREASPKIDAIVSGHTHTPYACTVAGRPVVQSGSYGGALSRVSLTLDEHGTVTAARPAVLPLLDPQGAPLYAADAEVQRLVDAATGRAEELGRIPVGSISSDILRGGTPPGADRSVESSLGNLLGDVTQWAVPGAEIGVTNPGGIRDDLRFAGGGAVTYRAVADVWPFANTLISVRLSGEQLRQLLEQQWQADGVGGEQKRHLGVSAALSYDYRPELPLGGRIGEVRVNGAPVDPARLYTVATNAFLANGGDGFSVFLAGQDRADTGRNDLQALVEYFAASADRGEAVTPAPLGRARLVHPDAGGGEGGDGSGGDTAGGGEQGHGGGTGAPPSRLSATGAPRSPVDLPGRTALVLLVAGALLAAAGSARRSAGGRRPR